MSPGESAKPSFGVAVIPIKRHEGVHLLAGSASLSPRPLSPYAEPVREFLAALSTTLRDDPTAGRMPDVATFAFAIRRGNIERLHKAAGDLGNRLGLGVVLHIAPSNVPVNFAFSYLFGLLAGNANIVRVPSREWPQVTAIYAAMNRVFSSGDHEAVRQRTAIVRYPRNAQATADFSKLCQGRLVWGGDATVQHVRTIPLPPRATEIAFADRYSLCVMNADAVAALDQQGLEKLANDFFNDTYLVDQNACSSPHLVIWYNTLNNDAEARFWRAVEHVARRQYAMEPIKQVDKYTHLLLDGLHLDGNAALNARHSEYVYRIGLDELPNDVETLRGRYGYFYEYHTTNLQQLARVVTPRYQTLTYFGVDRERLRDLVIGGGLAGIDRITPVGKALDIDVTWDGHDIVRSLSRIIDVR
ncbi:MAG: acyl-CoA reductase [Gammaproteobacteria bacterium]|nr:acyl-CoA reductase [Gammaproteobacteria bacterium]